MSEVEIRHKRAPLQIVTKQDEEGERTVRAVFATLGVIDHDGEIIEKGAIGKQSVVMAGWGHDHYSLPPGRGETSEGEYKDADVAFFDGQFFKTANGEEHYQTLKEVGDAQEWSFGFRVVDGGYEKRDGDDVFVIRKADVFEVSPVLMGAGIGTQTVGIKDCDGACQAKRDEEPEPAPAFDLEAFSETIVKAVVAGVTAAIASGQAAPTDTQADATDTEEPSTATSDASTANKADDADPTPPNTADEPPVEAKDAPPPDSKHEPEIAEALAEVKTWLDGPPNLGTDDDATAAAVNHWRALLEEG